MPAKSGAGLWAGCAISAGHTAKAVISAIAMCRADPIAPRFPRALALYIKAATSQANGRSLSKTPVIRLRAKEGRRVKAGAPWVFSNEIVMDGAAKSLAPGTLAELAADDGTKL